MQGTNADSLVPKDKLCAYLIALPLWILYLLLLINWLIEDFAGFPIMRDFNLFFYKFVEWVRQKMLQSDELFVFVRIEVAVKNN